jgi:hypothetical protein
MNKSFFGYFTFYNKNGLHYKIKDHSPLHLTHKYLLMVYVYFFFFLLISKSNIHRWEIGGNQFDIVVQYILFIILFYLMKIGKNGAYIYLFSFLTF